MTGQPAAWPLSRASYAIADQIAPSVHTLRQFFTVPPGATSVVVTFEMFVNDWSGAGPIVDPAGLDINVSNQHARVDVITADASSLDTGAGVVANLYLGVDAGEPPHPYTSYSFDIAASVIPGTSYQLRFAEVLTEDSQHLGVDNARITAVGDDVTVCGDNLVTPPETCDPPGGPGCDCRTEHSTPWCSSQSCEDAVCAIDFFCCYLGWDSQCVTIASGERECDDCCNAVCRSDCAFCGDGVVDVGETCDPPGGSCPSDCEYCVDTDADSICDLDDACPLSPNPGGGAAVFGQTITAADKTTLTWPSPADVFWVEGDLAQVSSYDVSSTDTAASTTSITVSAVPPSGGRIYLLVRPDCDPASWTSGGPGECASGCPPGGRDGNLP